MLAGARWIVGLAGRTRGAYQTGRRQGVANGPADGEIEALLRLGAELERRLIRRERRAERDVNELRAKLVEEESRSARAERRVERRRAEVADAEARLARRQTERAAGPSYEGSSIGPGSSS